MPLRLDDKWVWDFWHVASGGSHHLFYLQSPQTLGDPELRHWNVTIGHAVSDDLTRWTVLPDALAPAAPGAWDDYTTWTGSIVEHGGSWCMLYTGTSTADGGLVQRIGLATSDDLVAWEREGDRPVLEADPEWYELLNLEAWHDQAWRDPWVWLDPSDGVFHAYVAARSHSGEPRGRGVIGHARSVDLVSWEVLPPVTEPMGFGQMEVPQAFSLGQRSYLLFCGGREHHVDIAVTGTFFLSAESVHGPFPRASLGVLEADPAGTFYAGKVVKTAAAPVFMAWERIGHNGAFSGSISNPQPVQVAEDGSLQLDGAGPSLRPPTDAPRRRTL